MTELGMVIVLSSIQHLKAFSPIAVTELVRILMDFFLIPWDPLEIFVILSSRFLHVHALGHHKHQHQAQTTEEFEAHPSVSVVVVGHP